MNAANKEIRERTAVDLVNATILLMHLECKRFTTMRELAWRSDNVFTPRVEMEYNETFEGISYRDFNITIEEKEDRYEVATSRKFKATKMFSQGSNKGILLWALQLRCRHKRCGAVRTHGSYCDKYKDPNVDKDKYHAALVDAQHLAALIPY